MVRIQIHSHRPGQPSPSGNQAPAEPHKSDEVPQKKQKVDVEIIDDDEEDEEVLVNYNFLSWDCSTLVDVPVQTGLLLDEWQKNYDVILFTNVKNTHFLSHQMYEEFTQVVSSKQKWSDYRMALLSKIPPTKIEFHYNKGKESDTGGQIIFASFEKFLFIGTSAPYVGDVFEASVTRRQWNEALRKKIIEMDRLKPVVIAGDFKVAREIIDIGEMDNNELEITPRFSVAERKDFTALLNAGFKDTFREKNSGIQKFTTVPGEQFYPFVSYRANYILISNRCVAQVANSDVLMDDVLKSHPTVAEVYI